ncbi:MAG: hypothetical protein AAB067_01515 [Planctomycetota bacterium]
MKTTMTTSRLAATLPAAQRLAIPFLRRSVKPAPGLQPARRPAIPLTPITSPTNVEGNAATFATQEKQQDDGHNLPSGKQRETVVKERGGEGRPPVHAGLAELALKVRSCLLRTFTCFYPNNRKITTAAGNTSGRRSGSFYGKNRGKEGKRKTGKEKVKLGVGPFS